MLAPMASAMTKAERHASDDPGAVALARDASIREDVVVRGTWVAVLVLFATLTLLVVAGLVAGGPHPIPFLQAVATGALAIAILAYRRAVGAAEERRRVGEVRATRFLQGLSRSLSPEAVVSAVVEELRTASGADHVVVARLRADRRTIEATLVSASPDVPPSTTLLGAQRLDFSHPEHAAEQVGRMVRASYGLSHLLAAPLSANGRLLGALAVSHRTAGRWSPATRRLLFWAAGEVAAALERTYAHEDAETRASLDALTGLPNRRYLDELARLMTRRRRAGDAVGALMVDIDHFKRLNDRYGHATGDLVLRGVADAIAATVRVDDTPARYGGEEFAVVLRHASEPQAREVAERIRAQVARLRPGDLGIAEPVSVSVGVAVSNGDEAALEDLLARADRALYSAKRQGRDRVVVA